RAAPGRSRRTRRAAARHGDARAARGSRGLADRPAGGRPAVGAIEFRSMSGLPTHLAHWRWFLAALAVRARRVAILSAIAAKNGFLSLYNSDDLTHAASIAYYSLLSLFPFLLVLISVLGVVTSHADARAATLNFVLHYFPTRLDFVSRQLGTL